jgi:hypothetical protein
MSGRRFEAQPRPRRPRRVPAPAILFAFVALAWLGTGPARAQSLDRTLWVTDGDVNTVVPWGNTLYVGGSFGYVGPNTGGWTGVDVTGHATTSLPRLDGDVTAAIPDGAGGWFIGGTFTHVAGIARPGLARILADGSVSAMLPSPAPTGTATSLAHQGSRLFVATDSGQLLAFDDATGSAIGGWAPLVSGTVNSLAVSGTTLFAGGDLSFTITSSSATGTGIAAINTSTGAIEDWDPAPDGPVTRIQIDGRWLYATGTFSDIGAQAHGALARALVATRAFDSGWNPSVDAPVSAMATAASGLWIGGQFFFVGGEFRNGAAVLDTTSGATLALTPNLTGIDGSVSAITVRDPTVYLGISPQLVFPIGGTAKPVVIRLDAATGALDPGWRVLGMGSPTGSVATVSMLSVSSTGAVVAGGFVSAGGRHQVGVAAFDRSSGIARAWNPGLAVDESFPTVPLVSAIVPTNHAVYIGGYFTHAGGLPRKSLAAIDSASGHAQPWTANLAPVTTADAGSAAALALVQGKLVVGGMFSSIAGVSHAGLAQVDTASGTPVAGWSCDVAGSVNCLLVQGGTLFVGGAFSTAGGQPHAHIAAVNATTGAVQAWNPGVAGNAVQALAARGDSLYVGGDYSQVNSQTRVCLFAASISTGTLLGWAPTAFGPVRALVVDGPNLIVGGEFSFLNSQPVPYLGQVSRFTSLLVTGVPTADAEVFALAGDASSLYVGGRFGNLALTETANLAHVGGKDLLGPTVTVVAANGGEHVVIGTSYRFEYAASDPSGVESVDLELSRTTSTGPWTPLASGVRPTGHYDWTVTGPSVASSAWVRVIARDFAGNVGKDVSDAAFSIGAATTGVDPGAVPGGVLAFALGPNPARLRTDLRFTLQQPMRARFRLVDVQGREVWGSGEQFYEPGAHVVACELKSLAPGLYFMRFEHGNDSRTARLIVFR